MNDTDLMRDIEADERLRDAAPKMLAALKQCIELAEGKMPDGEGWRAIEAARVAIAAAEGKP